jgi:hypothetical protein
MVRYPNMVAACLVVVQVGPPVDGGIIGGPFMVCEKAAVILGVVLSTEDELLSHHLAGETDMYRAGSEGGGNLSRRGHSV